MIAITHHNLLPVLDLPLSDMMYVPGQRKLNVTVDSASVLHALNDLGVAALLHGHTHVVSSKHVVGYGSEDDQSTMLLGAGSLGLVHPSCGGHHIQVLEIDSKAIRINDLTCQAHQRNQSRSWERGGQREVKISRWWNRSRAERAVKAMASGAGTALLDWEAMHSWSRLPACSDQARWPRVLSQIFRDVHELPGGGRATPERIDELIRNLFIAPPGEVYLAGLTLQEYLLQRL